MSGVAILQREVDAVVMAQKGFLALEMPDVVVEKRVRSADSLMSSNPMQPYCVPGEACRVYSADRQSCLLQERGTQELASCKSLKVSFIRGGPARKERTPKLGKATWRLRKTA